MGGKRRRPGVADQLELVHLPTAPRVHSLVVC